MFCSGIEETSKPEIKWNDGEPAGTTQKNLRQYGCVLMARTCEKNKDVLWLRKCVPFACCAPVLTLDLYANKFSYFGVCLIELCR